MKTASRFSHRGMPSDDRDSKSVTAAPHRRSRAVDRAEGALQDDRAAQGLDAIVQPDEAGAAVRVGAAGAVVADPEVQAVNATSKTEASNR